MDERDEILADEVLGALLAKRVGDAQRLLRERPHLLSVRIGRRPLMSIMCETSCIPAFLVKTLLADLTVPIDEVTNDHGQTPLFYAVIRSKDSAEIIQFLLDRNANVNHVDSHGSSPLWFALCHCPDTTNTMQILISAGADVNIRNNEKSILMDACSRGKCTSVKLLLDAGARYSPLHQCIHEVPIFWAARRGFKDVTEVCLKHDNTMMQQTDRQGNTVLHVAVRAQQTECVSFLLDSGANMLAQSTEGKTPFEMAVGWHWLDGIYLMLLSNPAKILLFPPKKD